jgi:hypothetical protein
MTHSNDWSGKITWHSLSFAQFVPHPLIPSEKFSELEIKFSFCSTSIKRSLLVRHSNYGCMMHCDLSRGDMMSVPRRVGLSECQSLPPLFSHTVVPVEYKITVNWEVTRLSKHNRWWHCVCWGKAPYVLDPDAKFTWYASFTSDASRQENVLSTVKMKLEFVFGNEPSLHGTDWCVEIQWNSVIINSNVTNAPAAGAVNFIDTVSASVYGFGSTAKREIAFTLISF